MATTNSLIIREEGDYRIQGFEKINNALFDMIRKTFKVEPALGEIMFFKNSVYFTSQGCSRIAEVNHNKDIRFEYLNPETFPLLQVRKDPELFIIVKCSLTKEDGGIVEGYRILNLAEERKYTFPKKCAKCGQESRFFRRTSDVKMKECSHCGDKITGSEYWLFKDYCDFAETKAFMRAVKKAYNVKIIDELNEEEQQDAQDIRQVITVEAEAIERKSKDDKVLNLEVTQKSPPLKEKEKKTLTLQKKEPELPEVDEELITQMEEFEKLVDKEMEKTIDTKANQAQFEDWLKTLEKKKVGQDTYCKTHPQTISDSGKARQLKFPEFQNAIWFPNQAFIVELDGIWIREWFMLQKKKEFV